jgi:hypothetical protein
MEIMTTSRRHRGWTILLALAVLLAGLASASQAKLTDPKKLVSFLQIELPGWKVKAGYPKFERVKDKAGNSYVEGQVIYTSEQSTLTAVIMHGEISAHIAEVKKFPMADNEKGYVRKATVQGFQAVELFEKAKKSGFLFIFVAPDCMIPMEAKGVESAKVLRDLANKIDLPKLAAAVK